MNGDSSGLWTIDELAQGAQAALAQGYGGPPNGRVRDIPDERTIRYYTTLGLIDRPAEMSGRTALYGRRHLLQLVAIKQLQSRGHSLTEVQQAILGLPDERLAELAGLAPDGPGSRRVSAPVPSSAPASPPASAAESAPTSPRTRRSSRAFWREEPLRAAAARSVPLASANLRAAETPGAPGVPRMYQGIPLAAGVTLLLDSPRPLEAGDLEAIERAAAELIDTVMRRNIISSREGELR
jgi:DNA-binding transcriptional MerR regulator